MLKTVHQTTNKMIALQDIHIPQYMRRDVGKESIQELAQNIDKNGLLYNLLVNDKDGKYELIGGYRRYTAMSSLEWKDAPCRVFQLDDETAKLISVADNIHRKNYTRKELADLYKKLVALYGTVEEVAELLNKKVAEIKGAIAVINLADTVLQQVQNKIPDEDTRDTVTRLLPSLFDEKKQMAAIDIIADRQADEFTAKKIIRAIRENPDDDAEDAVKREFDVPSLIGIQVKLRSHVNKALTVFAAQNAIPKHEAAADFVEDGLVAVGLLIRKQNGRTRPNTDTGTASSSSTVRSNAKQRRYAYYKEYDQRPEIRERRAEYARRGMYEPEPEPEDTDTETEN
jgi:ParB family chromosome partitioning protein